MADDPRALRLTDAQFRPNQTLGLAINLFRICNVACAPGGPSACCGDITLVPVRPGSELDLLDGGQRPPPIDGGTICTSDIECDDENACTDDRCESGSCSSSAPRTCPDDGDGDPCTASECDAESGECVANVAGDGVECGDAGELCCGGACVDTATSTEHCSACGTACASNESCTSAVCDCSEGFDRCGGECVSLTSPAHCGRCDNTCTGATPACLGATCGACATAADCPPDDRHPCTADTPTCVDGACVYEILPGACLIDGACFPEGGRDRDNSCHTCDPARSQDQWSDRDGETCDDGVFCTTGTMCDGTVCTGATPLDCDDGLDCTTDGCGESANRCLYDVRTGCLIDGVCVSEGARNPANQCEECRGSRSREGWTLAVGAVCDDGRVCTIDDTCQLDGMCGGTPNPCNDGLSCTSDSCNTTTDTCVNAVQSGFCAVNDGASSTCYASGTGAAGNTCALCDPSRSTTSLTPVTEETFCMPSSGMGGGHCCAGVCQPFNSLMHCGTCGNVCTGTQVCGIYSMTPPDFRCCTTCPPPP